MSDKGYHLRKMRMRMDVPQWHNRYRGDARRAPCPTMVDIVGMVNYCLKLKAIDRVVSLRSYRSWEENSYPLWFECGMPWIYPIIYEIIHHAERYDMLKTGDNKECPIVVAVPTLEDRIRAVKLNRQCITINSIASS